MDVSIIIVNYKVKYFLEQTLLSAKEALEGFEGEIIVVDNNSGDDSIPFLKERFPDVNFIVCRDNLGFGRANNIGIRESKGEYVLILNPDTIIGRDSIKDCVNWMRSHSDCGAIGVKMLDGNGVFLPESKRSFPTPWVSFCKIFGLSNLFPKSKFFAKYHLRYLSKDEPHKVDILSGAFMFMRGDVLKKVGGFDKDFFMYGEDIDLSYRVIKEGCNNYYVPTPIIHYKGECTKKNSMKYVTVFYDAMLIFFRKHYPHYSFIYSFFVKAGIIMRASIAAMKRFVMRLFGRVNIKMPVPTTWCLVSEHPEELDVALDKEEGDKVKPIVLDDLQNVGEGSGTLDVVLDNRLFDYNELIRTIERYAQNKVRFHIYSAQNKLIISPKSNLS